MKLTETYEVIERVILDYLIDELKFNEQTIDEWRNRIKSDAEARRVYYLTVLGVHKANTQEAIKDAVEDATTLILTFMHNQFGENIKSYIDEEVYQKKAIGFLNENVIAGLVGAGLKKGAIEQQIDNIINYVIDNLTEDTDIEELIAEAIQSELQNGLDSGYFQKDGVQWKLDRYVTEVFINIYLQIYREQQSKALSDNHLVKVFKYPNPRDACQGLEKSEIISILPRDELTGEEQQYACIYDAEHKYLEPDGHHGINCRHVWHHVDAKENTGDALYNIVDEARLRLQVKRMGIKEMIKEKI